QMVTIGLPRKEIRIPWWLLGLGIFAIVAAVLGSVLPMVLGGKSTIDAPVVGNTGQQGAPPAQAAPSAQTAEQTAGGSTATQPTPVSSSRVATFVPQTFTAVPSNPTTPEERIAAIYLLAAAGKIDTAVGLAPATDREAWREHLEAETKSTPPSIYNRRGIPARLPPGSVITITALYVWDDGGEHFLTNLTKRSGIGVEVRRLPNGEIAKLAPD
ncbi:MAG: hypothetical protein AAB538_03390, partial [Patescibacteria group bacterium]